MNRRKTNTTRSSMNQNNVLLLDVSTEHQARPRGGIVGQHIDRLPQREFLRQLEDTVLFHLLNRVNRAPATSMVRSPAKDAVSDFPDLSGLVAAAVCRQFPSNFLHDTGPFAAGDEWDFGTVLVLALNDQEL